MKKNEVSGRKFKYPNGKTILFVHYEWRFTDEEKENIRKIIKNEAPDEGIEVFIRHLEFICNGKKNLLENPRQSKLRLTREKILTDCKAALGHLKQIERGKVTLWTHDTLKGYGTGTMKDTISDLLVAEFESAWKAVGPLEQFTKLLETHHRAENKKYGRKKTDSDAFIRMLAEIYNEHIGKPSNYEDGPFFALVRTILEILHLSKAKGDRPIPFKDPSRAIRGALSK